MIRFAVFLFFFCWAVAATAVEPYVNPGRICVDCGKPCSECIHVVCRCNSEHHQDGPDLGNAVDKRFAKPAQAVAGPCGPNCDCAPNCKCTTAKECLTAKARCLVFSIDNCPACEKLHAAIVAISAKGWISGDCAETHFQFIYADDGKAGTALAEKYKIKQYPTSVVIDVKTGKELVRQIGFVSGASIATLLNDEIKGKSQQPSRKAMPIADGASCASCGQCGRGRRGR